MTREQQRSKLKMQCKLLQDEVELRRISLSCLPSLHCLFGVRPSNSPEVLATSFDGGSSFPTSRTPAS